MKTPACESLHLFVDGELDPVDGEAFRLHLAACPTCPDELSRLLQLDATARAAAPEGFTLAIPEVRRMDLVIKYVARLLGGHVHIDCFVGPGAATLAKSGELCVTDREWPAFAQMIGGHPHVHIDDRTGLAEQRREPPTDA